MGLPQCNTTLEDARLDETPLFNTHNFTFHQLILVISAACGLIAIIVSLFLMFMHATHYSRPTEQRHIIRILFMVPVYALVSFLSIWFYYHSVYYEVLRDCYEAFAIASFFSLMCAYLADDLHHQKEYFRKIKPKPWIWPMKWFQKCCGGDRGCLRTPRSGLTWFNVIWVAVFQYCFIRVSMTITAVVTQYFDRYCLESLNPAFAHVWVMVIEAVAVTITMYCIIQFYVQIREDVAQHKPILKVLAIKLVIFLSFWQTIIISFLTSSGAIEASNKIETPDIKVGIPSLLLCIEMALFAIFHLWSFSYRPYVIGSKQYQAVYGHLDSTAQARYRGGPLGMKAILECFNPWDLIKATGRSAKWLFVGRARRMEDASYTSVNAQGTDVQKMNDLDNGTTAYGGAGATMLTKKPVRAEEGSGLLARAQQPAGLAPRATHESDGSGSSPWTDVEAKEYFQDQEMQKKTGSQRADFQTANTNPYDTRYTGKDAYGPRSSSLQPPRLQETGISRPAGTAPGGGQPLQQHLPMVTRRDIEDMQHNRQGQAPYPRSVASIGVADHHHQ
ncbi:hypothetical protein LTR64_007328 [Lithohypha guttulata]|uniref:uncharacterized protein n=1 Tax=Lithohypha guttulata TaxID=1690604 RepID=UPI00315C8EB0